MAAPHSKMSIKAVLLFLLVFLLASLGAIAKTSCNSWWTDETCLTVHPDVDLGTIDSSLFHGATPEGSGALQPLTALDNAIDIARNGWANLNWTLEVKAASSLGVALSRLHWRHSGTGEGYLPFSSLGAWTQVATGRGSASVPVDYEYLPTTADAPGNHQVTLTYRVTISWGSYELYSVSEDTVLFLNARDWIVLAINDRIDLGTIDGAGYVMGRGLPARDSVGNGMFIVSNLTTGWDVTLQVGSLSTPPCYRGDLLRVFFWQIDGSTFRSASGLQAQPITVASSSAPGKVQHTLGYRYTPTTAECGGDYSISLIYTATPR